MLLPFAADFIRLLLLQRFTRHTERLNKYFIRRRI